MNSSCRTGHENALLPSNALVRGKDIEVTSPSDADSKLLIQNRLTKLEHLGIQHAVKLASIADQISNIPSNNGRTDCPLEAGGTRAAKDTRSERSSGT